MIDGYCNQKESALFLGIRVSQFSSMIAQKFIISDKTLGRTRLFSKGLLERTASAYKDLIKRYKETNGRHEMPMPKPDDNLTREQLHGDTAYIPKPLPKSAAPHSSVARGCICAKCRHLKLADRGYSSCGKFRLVLEKDNLSNCGCPHFVQLKQRSAK